MHVTPQLAYVEGWKLINLANETFGFNGWSHSVTHQNIGKGNSLVFFQMFVYKIMIDKNTFLSCH